MTRIFSVVFVVVAVAVIFAVLALPAMLASQDSSEEDYKRRLADWHVRWSNAADAAARQALLPGLDTNRLPTGSIEYLDRHRIYTQAHVIYSQAEIISRSALGAAEGAISAGDSSAPLNCTNVDSRLEQLGENVGGTAELTRASEACALFISTGQHLVILRAQAVTGWLEKEINKISP